MMLGKMGKGGGGGASEKPTKIVRSYLNSPKQFFFNEVNQNIDQTWYIDILIVNIDPDFETFKNKNWYFSEISISYWTRNCWYRQSLHRAKLLDQYKTWQLGYLWTLRVLMSSK